MSLPSRGVNGARPLLESPVELPAGLSARMARLFAKGRWGISDGWNPCDVTLFDVEEDIADTSETGGGCDRPSGVLAAEVRKTERGWPGLWCSLSEGESGIEWIRGTGGMREALRDVDGRVVEVTDIVSDLSF